MLLLRRLDLGILYFEFDRSERVLDFLFFK